MSKTFSIVMPVYNRSQELQRALKSLSNQTDQDFEVVICDDGSSEDIASVIANFSNLDILYDRISPSGSPSRPRNVALGRATGQWISFLDSDDWWSVQRIEKLKEMLSDADIVHHKLEIVYSNNAQVRRKQKVVGQKSRRNLLRGLISQGNPFATSATTVRRKLVNEVGQMWEAPTGDAIDDFDLWLRLAAQCNPRVKFLDQSMGYYEVSDNNISAFGRKQYIRHRRLYRRQLSILPENIKEYALSNFAYSLGCYALRLGMLTRAAYHFSCMKIHLTPRKCCYAVIKFLITFTNLELQKR